MNSGNITSKTSSGISKLTFLQTGAHLNRVLAHGSGFGFGFGGGGGLSDEEVNVVDQAKGNESYICWCLEAEQNGHP